MRSGRPVSRSPSGLSRAMKKEAEPRVDLFQQLKEGTSDLHRQIERVPCSVPVLILPITVVSW